MGASRRFAASSARDSSGSSAAASSAGICSACACSPAPPISSSTAAGRAVASRSVTGCSCMAHLLTSACGTGARNDSMAAPPRKRKIDPAPPSTYRFSDDLYVERGIVAAWLTPPGFPADTQRQYAQVLARMVLSYHDPRLHPQFPARVRALLGELEAAPDAADEPAPDAAAVVAEVRALVANIGTVLKAALDTPSATAAGVVRDVNAQLNGLSLIALGGRMQLQMLLQQLYREVFGAAYDAADGPRVETLDVRPLSEFRNIGRLGADGFGDAGTMTVTRDPFASAAEQKAVYMGEMHEAAIRAGSTHTKYLLAPPRLHPPARRGRPAPPPPPPPPPPRPPAPPPRRTCAAGCAASAAHHTMHAVSSAAARTAVTVPAGVSYVTRASCGARRGPSASPVAAAAAELCGVNSLVVTVAVSNRGANMACPSTPTASTGSAKSAAHTQRPSRDALRSAQSSAATPTCARKPRRPTSNAPKRICAADGATTGRPRRCANSAASAGGCGSRIAQRTYSSPKCAGTHTSRPRVYHSTVHAPSRSTSTPEATTPANCTHALRLAPGAPSK